MHSKHKGAMAEAKVMADLIDKGYSVAVVFDDLQPFDLITIDKEYNLYKVQVKYCKVTKSGSAVLKLENSMSNKTLLYTKKYLRSEVDIFAAYIPGYNLCLYVKSNILDTHKKAFTFRLTDTTKSNMKKGVNFSRDYLHFPAAV